MTRYTAMLLAPILATAFIGLAMAWWLQPLAGDLTRLGWWSEREFGWNGAEEYFDPPLAHTGGLQRADIVVIGDSFSNRLPLSQSLAGTYWTNWLARETGLSVSVVDSYQVTMEELVAALPNLRPPPAAVIMEAAERYVPARYGGKLDIECRTPAAPAPPAMTASPSTQAALSHQRAVQPSLTEPPIGYGLQYLWRSSLRRLGLAPPTEVAMVPIARRNLFSNRDSGHMLVHRDELRKPAAGDPAWRAAACELLGWQGRVQAAVPTLFLLVVAPDRMTAYADVLADPKLRQPNGIDALAAEPRLNLVRLDRAFQAAISGSERDLYLPNDTHWSSRGHGLAAHIVREELERFGVLRRVDAAALGRQ